MIKKKSSNLLLFTGGIAILIITIAIFCKDSIIYKYYEYKITKEYAKCNINDYYLEDHFNYVDNYTDSGIKNKEEFIGFLYYALNSGSKQIIQITKVILLHLLETMVRVLKILYLFLIILFILIIVPIILN